MANPFAHFALVMVVFQTIFMLLGKIVIAWFSRWRGFRADAGGARLAGRGALTTPKIAGGARGLRALMATHPPLELRIARLKEAA